LCFSDLPIFGNAIQVEVEVKKKYRRSKEGGGEEGGREVV